MTTESKSATINPNRIPTSGKWGTIFGGSNDFAFPSGSMVINCRAEIKLRISLLLVTILKLGFRCQCSGVSKTSPGRHELSDSVSHLPRSSFCHLFPDTRHLTPETRSTKKFNASSQRNITVDIFAPRLTLDGYRNTGNHPGHFTGGFGHGLVDEPNDVPIFSGELVLRNDAGSDLIGDENNGARGLLKGFY